MHILVWSSKFVDTVISSHYFVLSIYIVRVLNAGYHISSFILLYLLHFFHLSYPSVLVALVSSVLVDLVLIL